METWDDDSKNTATTENNEKKEEILVSAGRAKQVEEDTAPGDVSKDETLKIPRRWYIY